MGAIVIFVVVALGIGSLVGAAYTGLFGPRARARRRLDRGAVRQFVEGEIVTLTGTVEAVGELLEAPLSGESCVVYAVQVDFYEVSAKMSRYRTPIESFRDGKFVRFRLVTSEVTVDIDATTADSSIPLTPVIPRDPRREIAFLRSHDKTTDLELTGGFAEYSIAPGARIRVQGVAVIETTPRTDVETDYRSSVAPRVLLKGHADHPLTIGLP